jgi:hypothetical protein
MKWILPKAFVERPSPFWVLLLLPLVPLAFVVHKLTAQMFAVGLLATSVLVLAASGRLPLVVAYNFCVVSTVVFTLAPIDLAIRSFEKWNVGFMPVVHTIRPEATRRHLQETGQVENVDVVVYERREMLFGPYRVLIVTVPINARIMTPL